MKKCTMKKILYLLAGLLLLACEKDSSEPEYIQYQARWQSYQFSSYLMKQSLQCYCPGGGTLMNVTVENNRITEVKTPEGVVLSAAQQGLYKTVDELFEIIRNTDPGKVEKLEVTYDPQYGYPSLVYIDRSKAIADEETGYRTQLPLR